MRESKMLVERHTVLLFCAIVLLLTYGTYFLPLPSTSRALVFAFIIAFIPSFAATILTTITDGYSGVKSLFKKLTYWRNWKWLAISLIVGFILRLMVSIVALLLGQVSSVISGDFSPLLVSVFIFAAGEELGWRGYALPHLLKTQSLLSASLMLGVPWAVLHLSLYLPGMMNAGLSALPQLFVLVALSVMLAWVWAEAKESGVIAAILLHGGQNFFVFLNGKIDSDTAAWLMAVVYVITAIVIIALHRQKWLSRPTPGEIPA